MGLNGVGHIEHAVNGRPARGEIVSGDVARVRMVDGYAVAGIADVLGHGPAAHEVAKKISTFMLDDAEPDTADTLNRLDTLLQGTVGAAVAFCSVELSSGRVSYAGVGNITVRCIWPAVTAGSSFVPRDGIVGASTARRHIHMGAKNRLTLEQESVLLLYTDGIRSSLMSSGHPGLASSDMTFVARTVVENFGLEHDDATCLAVRYQP